VLVRPIGEAKPPSADAVENSASTNWRAICGQASRRDGAVPWRDAVDVDGPWSSRSRRPKWASRPLNRRQAKPDGLQHPSRRRTRRSQARQGASICAVGVLIYRLDRPALCQPGRFCADGYPSLHALEEAGGLDALLCRARVSNAPARRTGTRRLTISASQPDANMRRRRRSTPTHTIAWDAIRARFDPSPAPIVKAPNGARFAEATRSSPKPSPVGHAIAEELGGLLDTTAKASWMLRCARAISIRPNRSAKALFGHGREDLRNAISPTCSRRKPDAVFYYLASVNRRVESLLDHGRDTLGRVAKGGIVPLVR